MTERQCEDAWRLERRVLAFLDALCEAGFPKSNADAIAVVEAAHAVGAFDRDGLRVALRSVLCRDRDQWQRFDPLFDAWFAPRAPALTESPPVQGVAVPVGARAVTGEPPAVGAAPGAGASVGAPGDALQQVNLGSVFDPLAMREMDVWIEAMTRRVKRDRRRRQRRGTRKRVQLSQTLRNAHSTGGEPFRLSYAQPQRRLPPLVVFVDVSQSMNAYARFFLQLARGLAGAFERCEVYGVDTELVPLGDFVREAKASRAAAVQQTVSWRGGTRIAHAFDQFWTDHARDVLTPKATVLIMSDGYDTAPPEQLAQQLARLRPHVRRVLWLHPLLERAGGASLDPCIVQSFASIDRMLPAHSLDALGEIAAYIT